ncbi:MAG: MBL fold metallo-hydrolase [Alphaproteobacteria bacterium]
MTASAKDREPDGPIYPFADPAPIGEPFTVAPGVEWLRMPLPFALDHINLWLVADGDGWTLIDSGLATDPIKAVWRELFATRFSTAPARRLMLTHFHPDHVGLAGWLEAEYGVGLWTSNVSFMVTQLAWLDQGKDREAARLAHFTAHGVDPAAADAMLEVFRHYPRDVSRPPLGFTRIDDGERVRIGDHDWIAMNCEGHATGHLCFHCPTLGVLIAGDQVLPRITPNISAWEEQPDDDPIADFVASLKRLAALPEDSLVLLSHGLPYYGLRPRVAALINHHDERLTEIRGLCAAPRTAMSLLPKLFRPGLDPFQSALALGEVIAHLNWLTKRGQVVRETGPDGLIRFEDSLA